MQYHPASCTAALQRGPGRQTDVRIRSLEKLLVGRPSHSTNKERAIAQVRGATIESFAGCP